MIYALLFSVAASAQAQGWHWGKQGQNYVKDVVSDHNGNTYVLWTVSEGADIDGHAIETYSTGSDIAISSFRCDGTYRWTKVIGTNSSDVGSGLGVDSLGGLYILAHLGNDSVSNTYIDTDEVLGPTWKRTILIKYDTGGTYQWHVMPEPDMANPFDPYYFTAGFNLTVEPGGNVHLMAVLDAGDYADGAFTASYGNEENIYALKYDENGNFLAGIHFDISKDSLTGAIAFGFTLTYDPVSNHYYWNGSRFNFDDISFGGVAVTGMNFLACFDENGDILWVQKSNEDDAYTFLEGKVAIDPAGNIYATGTASGWDTDGFGAYSLNNAMGVWSYPFLVKFSKEGEVIYLTNASGNTDNMGAEVAYRNGTLALGGIYAGGDFGWQDMSLGTHNQYYNAFVARFNPATGKLLGFDTLSSGPMVDEYITTLTSDIKGNFYLGGEFTNNIKISESIFTKSDGYTDGFLAKTGTLICDCLAPDAVFSYSSDGERSFDFSYEGELPVDSVMWFFGGSAIGEGSNASYTYSENGIYTVCVVAFNDCGSSEFCYDVETGEGNSSTAPGAGRYRDPVLYPNPAKDILHIEGLQEQTGYEIYDYAGRRIQSGSVGISTNSFSIGDLTPGNYIVRLKGQKGMACIKFVVNE